ncbi:stage II sporulation protein M [Longimicrobium sp.]|uniref:stage II sporulation protein M n=1 Tax=Longimicrobium sp. TaxID=2029185 RepID=UPI002C9CA544|nr:stage II sporulation protein M [Longimicrobium sp.]HSU16904.1 stage II sporulation protein M [Longimicrobium sp.]
MAQAAAAYVLNDRQVDIETPEHVSVGYELADMGSRFLARLIDWLILLVFWIILFIVSMYMLPAVAMAGETGVAVLFGGLLIVQLVVAFGYSMFFECFRDGQTPGKKVMRIRVVQDGGYPLGVQAAVLRNLLRIVDLQPVISCGVAGLSMMLHPRTKRLGDIAAGTVVVRDRSGQPIPEEHVPRNAPALGPPRLAEQEFAALSMYVERRASLEYPVRARLAGTLMQRLAHRLGNDPRQAQMPVDHYLGMLYEEEGLRRRASGAGGRAGSGQATALFRRQRPAWDAYGRMLEEARRGGLAAMGEARVSRFAAMYRELSADLARARTYGGSPELLFALERAVGAGHNLLYRAPSQGWAGVRRFVTGGFAVLVRRHRVPIAVASALFYLPALFTFAAVRRDPAVGRDLMPPQMMARAELAAERRAQGKGYVNAEEQGGMVIMSSEIMVNNIVVTIKAYAGGMLAGVGTVLALVFNGIPLGVVAGIFANYHQNLHLWAFILPHGVFELTAICIAGGAGLLLASAILLPGRQTRGRALVERGRESVQLFMGTLLMLVIAGIIEGFISPSHLPNAVKLSLAALFATLLVTYLTLAGRDQPAPDASAA